MAVWQVADSSLDNRTLRGVDGIISEKGNRKMNRCSGGKRDAQKHLVVPPSFGISLTLFAALAHPFNASFDALRLRDWWRRRRGTGYDFAPRHGHRSRRQRHNWGQRCAGECRLQDGTYFDHRGAVSIPEPSSPARYVHPPSIVSLTASL